MAAGQGFKTFTTGEVLTAGDVNGYLMQGINVFASSSARSAAITSPQEGQYSYLKDTNALEYYDGSAWVGAPVGDITAVTAGKGLTGGGSSGDVTVSLATTAKGDLVAGSGASTATVLTVGSNGETLVPDSSTSTGLRWQGNYAAGKNKIINGDFGIWQRGTSLATYGYLADRFLGDTNATVTQSRQTFTPGTAPVAGYEGSYFYRLAKSAGGSYVSLQQRIEDVRTFAGQTITLSFWAKIDSGTQSVGTAFEQNFGSGGSSGVYTYGSNVTLTTTWTRYSVTVTLPSIAGKTIGTSSFLNVFSLNLSSSAAITFDYWGVQLEAGSVATSFQTATGTIQGELAACQRYFNRFSSADNAYNNFSTGNVRQTGAGAASYFNFFYPVEMRIAPTAVTTANITSCRIQQGATDSTVTSAAFDGSTTKNGTLKALATIITAGTGTLAANNATNVTIDWSAEL